MSAVLGELRGKVDARELPPADQSELRRVLYGLHVLVKPHVKKEEDAYLPLLDARLTPEQAGEMFERMESAAAAAKRQAGTPCRNDRSGQARLDESALDHDRAAAGKCQACR